MFRGKEGARVQRRGGLRLPGCRKGWQQAGISDGKEICLQCGRPGFDSWVRTIPWRREWQSTPVF